MVTLLLSELPLGISGVKIALHLLNFVILMTGMTFILYKPIKKYIKARQDRIANQLKENEEAKATATAALEEYNAKLNAVDVEIENKIKESHEAIQVEKEVILNAAHKRAEEMFKKAEEECAAEHSQAVCHLQTEVAEVAVNLASNILEREITLEEHEKIIDACIIEWSEND